MGDVAQQLAVDAEGAEGPLVIVDDDVAFPRHGQELG